MPTDLRSRLALHSARIRSYRRSRGGRFNAPPQAFSSSGLFENAPDPSGELTHETLGLSIRRWSLAGATRRGAYAKALASIKARTLILTGTKDLLNPEFEPQQAGKNIADVKMMTISPGTVTGHASAGGAIPSDVEFLNRETGVFLDTVTEGGKKLN